MIIYIKIVKDKGGWISQEKESFGFREQLIIISAMICVEKKQDDLVERVCCFNKREINGKK